jgi:hypothetical protein
MAYFIDFMHWQIKIVCDCQLVIEGLRSNFDFRFGVDYHPNKTLLTCTIIRDDTAYNRLLEQIDFNSRRVDVSQTVTLDYGFDGPLTWLKVTNTAIIAFDSRNSTECHVWLPPLDIISSDQESVPNVPCAEAFFYPLLAEWLRAFNACLVHCGAVTVDGRAVIISGPSGSGKSTHVLRMLLAGADFLADDLAILYQDADQLYFYPLREVANVNQDSILTFPELDFIKGAPLRGDGKFLVNVPQYFHKKAVDRSPSGIVLRLYPDTDEWIKPCAKDNYLDNIHKMAWFSSRPEGNIAHFWLLTDWLMSCEQWCVSQGYLAHHLDTLMHRLHSHFS